MEALEVDDISPALEVTEDFFSCFDSKLEKVVQQAEVYGIQEVPELVGHEVYNKIADSSAIRSGTSLGKGSSIIWDSCQSGLLETKVQNVFPAKEQLIVQRGTAPDNLSWMEQREASTFNFFNICQRRRDRPRSVNDLLDETSSFKPGHVRSRSDTTHVEWGVVFKSTPLHQPSVQGTQPAKSPFLSSSHHKGKDAQGNTVPSWTSPYKKLEKAAFSVIPLSSCLFPFHLLNLSLQMMWQGQGFLPLYWKIAVSRPSLVFTLLFILSLPYALSNLAP